MKSIWSRICREGKGPKREGLGFTEEPLYKVK